jgi:hypothetical protein
MEVVEFHEEFEEGRDYLLKRATDAALTGALDDIINCDIKKVLRGIDNIDIITLYDFVKLPLNTNGKMNFDMAKKQIEKILINFPAFRSCDPCMVCRNIATYYANRAREINEPLPLSLNIILETKPKKE